MRPHAIQLTIVALSALLSLDMLLLTGLADGANWYSSESAYRRQTDSLCRGRLALSEDPRDLDWDMVWHNGRVHQVWGLGVPMVRLPFELFARLLGATYFPDRLTFGVAVFLVAYATCRILLPLSLVKSPRDLFSDHPAAVSSVALLLLFPPFLTLCQTRFLGYEEAVAYGYLAGTLLLVLTINASKSLTPRSVFALSVVAGFAPFIRPTLLAYSVASVLVAGLSLWSTRGQWMRYVAAFSPLPMLIAVLCATNADRFGSPLEFGHAVNLNTLDPMRYVSRFGSPFRDEPLTSVALELFSCLFLTNDHFNGRAWYQQDFFPGQAQTLRWREFYFTTFDLSYLVLILAGWITGAWWFVTRHEKSQLPQFAIVRNCVLWSVTAVIPMSLFYLRFPSVSSRYNMDFAPAFCAAIVAYLYGVESWLCRVPPRDRLTAWGLCLACGVWLVGHISTAETEFPIIPPISARQAAAEMILYRGPSTVMAPPEYKVGKDLSSIPLPFNAAGWDLQSGTTKAAVALWIEQPRYIELTVTAAEEGPLSDLRNIRAKIGLEHLNLISSQTFGRHAVLHFQGPASSNYKGGLQVAYIGLVATKDVSESDSPFKLTRVTWGTGSGASAENKVAPLR